MATFTDMLKKFAIVTVMNAKVYKEVKTQKDDKTYMTPEEVIQAAEATKELCTLNTLKIANVTMEGPTKTVTGGQYTNPLVKFGKTARLEMQDALGRANAIEALCGGIVEDLGGEITGLHFGEDFVGPKMIIGDSFFIDRKSGQQVKVKIIFYQFLPDSIFNLTQDAEGDATVFDMNGDLLTTEILVGRSEGEEQPHGVFYSIINPEEEDKPRSYFEVKYSDNGDVTISARQGYSVNEADSFDIAKGHAARLKVEDTKTKVVVFDEVFCNY